MTRARESRLSVESLRIDALKLDPRNPRRHSTRQIKQIARSIRSFGFNVPVLVNAENHVLTGNGRVLGAKEAGLREVPVIRLEHLTEAQARAFAIADNRLSELSSWDEGLLREVLVELAALDLDFSLEDTGFAIAEIDVRIEAAAKSADKPDPADELPSVTAPHPVTQAGDLWQLDNHRILCADARQGVSFAALLSGKRAHMAFADPPYNVRIDGHVCGHGAIHHREFAMASGEMSRPEFEQFLATVLREVAAHTESGSLHYICIDWRGLHALLGAGDRIYRELKNLCVWVKGSPGMGTLYRSQHEFIAVYKKGNRRHRNNVELGRHGRNRTNVWQYPSPSSFGRTSEEGNLLAMHPTVKPVAMIADAILDCTGRGDIVLDPFLGSGSTLIAAQRVGRICHGMEIDPTYVDTAVRRWQRFTGSTAIHARIGERFDDIEARMQGDDDR